MFAHHFHINMYLNTPNNTTVNVELTLSTTEVETVEASNLFPGNLISLLTAATAVSKKPNYSPDSPELFSLLRHFMWQSSLSFPPVVQSQKHFK
jgi:hypothetical protein